MLRSNVSNILITIFIITIIAGCKDMVIDSYYGSFAEGHSLYYSEEFEQLNTFEKITSYMNLNTFYNSEDDLWIWFDPETTLSDGGTCVDLSILFMDIAYYGMGIKVNLVCGSMESVDTSPRKIVNGGTDSTHAAIEYNGLIYSPFIGWYYQNFRVDYIYFFNEVFSQK